MLPKIHITNITGCKIGQPSDLTGSDMREISSVVAIPVLFA